MNIEIAPAQWGKQLAAPAPYSTTQYQRIANTIVQLIRRSTSGVIAPSQQTNLAENDEYY
jgi:hypothetical protein